jgi:hypothetical protein
MTSELQNLIEQFGLPEAPKTHQITKDLVTKWMQSSDIEVLGALYAFLMDSKYSKRIFPGVTLQEYMDFITHYFERCLIEDAEGNWAHGRYAAAWDFASWFGALWKDKNIEKEDLRRLKSWLGDVYVRADNDIKHCIVTGTLEHLLEDREIAVFFSDWKKDKLLADAYSEASLWSKE